MGILTNQDLICTSITPIFIKNQDGDSGYIYMSTDSGTSGLDLTPVCHPIGWSLLTMSLI
jgi:hypothetical protein